MTDSSQEEKQNFLREKILEKGYDTNQFVQFLIDKKGEDGADVSVWTMNDLKLVVKEFIKLNGGQVEEEEPPKPQPKQESKTSKKISMFDVLGESKPKAQPQPQTQTQPQKPKIETQKVEQKQNNQQNIEQKPKNEQSSTTNNSVPNSANNTVNKQPSVTLTGNESDYGVIIAETKKCKPCEKTDIAKSQNVSITLSKPEKKKGGFLAKDYMTYLITTLPVSYKVRRRYSDFGWLRTALQNHFPADLIPPIPKRNNRFGVDPFGEQFVSKRLRGLERFLNYLTKDPIIKSSQLFYDFLYIGAEVDFNSKKKVYEKVKPVSDVEEFRESDEKVKLSITNEKEGYLENIKDNTNINIHLFKKLNISFKLLFDEMNNVINRMNEISNTWEQIFKASEKYYDNNTTCESYRQMSNLFKTWSKILKEQNTIVNVDIREHFKFIRKNFGSMKELVNSIENQKYNYQKNVKNLMSKKEELFKKSDPSKWELDPKKKNDFVVIATDKKTAIFKMCPKETSAAVNLKEFYGYYLNRALSEYERMRNLNGILNKEVVVANINKLTQISSQFHICIGEINSALDVASSNKTNDQKCKLKRIPLDETLLK